MSTTTESLRKLGLTDYEAKVLIALTKAGSGTAADIHTLSGIPRSAVYGVLAKLEEKGIIETQHTKPMRYKAILPSKAIEKLKKDYVSESEHALAKLEEMYKTHGEETKEEAVWTINGVKNVNDKIVHMIGGAISDIIFAASYPEFHRITETYPILNRIKQVLLEKIDDGISVRITGSTESGLQTIAEELAGADVRTYGAQSSIMQVKGGILIVDGAEVLITIIKDVRGREDLTAIWSNGNEFISILKHFVEAEWSACTLPK